ncbi:hypothetical protein [Pseudomonas sp.]|uniref:hypothetical protein n=1 Tax=Pseudomonas sp. TaxID=306 RepID=UPI0028A5B2AC|nr:hypothetical protein [Pseudomonas sp.]
MAEGFRIRNANGFVQVDSNYRNAALVTKYTINPGGASNPNGMFLTDFTIPYGINPLVVGTTPGGNNAICMHLLSRSGNAWTYRIATTTRNPIELYHFDNMSIAPVVGKVGMRVRNINTGEIVFDSRCKYMRVLDFIHGKSEVADFPRQTKNYAVTKTGVLQATRYVTSPSLLMPGNPPMILAMINESIYSAMGGTVILDVGNLITVGPSTNVSAFEFENWSWGYLVLDLSNFD